jgi:hypothetical protein
MATTVAISSPRPLRTPGEAGRNQSPSATHYLTVICRVNVLFARLTS